MKIGAFIHRANQISGRDGKSILSQLFEIIFLRLAKNRLGMQEYYEFEAHDDRQFSMREKLQFVGVRKEGRYGRLLNARPWNVFTGDKLAAYATFRGLDLPYPKIKAIYHPYGRQFPGAATLTTPAELADYLRRDVDYPFFSKPAHGAGGQNSAAAIGYDPDADCLIQANGNKVPICEFVENCHPNKHYPWEAGFIFQELAKPAEECQEAFGPTIPGIRSIMFNPDGDARLFRAVLKIPTGKSMTDNFGFVGETGTIAAELDPEEGVIVRAQKGTAPDMESVESHPDTDAPVLGFRIPHWDAYLALLKRATKAFPGIRLQHWDIGISDRGPIIYELNTFGGFGLPQIATRNGMCDREFVQFIEELGRKYPYYTGRDDY